MPDAESKEGLPYEIEHYWEQLVSQYLGCPLVEVFDLCSLDYLALKREAFIFEMSKTEEGRKSLSEAKIFEAKDADYQGIIELQKLLGGEG